MSKWQQIQAGRQALFSELVRQGKSQTAACEAVGVGRPRQGSTAPDLWLTGLLVAAGPNETVAAMMGCAHHHVRVAGDR
jgi:hypothetical protein